MKKVLTLVFSFSSLFSLKYSTAYLIYPSGSINSMENAIRDMNSSFATQAIVIFNSYERWYFENK